MKGKGSRAFSKGQTLKPEVTVREQPPRIKESGESLEILCPYCALPHPIAVGVDSSCGTTLHVSAVQTVYPARTVNKHKMICIKCGEGGGEMIRYNNSTIHLKDCRPDVQLAATMPKFNRLAGIVYKLPARVRKLVEGWTGFAKQLKEVDGKGAETGKVLGYFFYQIPKKGT